MRLIYDEEDRSELADLGNIQIPTEDGRLSTVAAVTTQAFLSNEDNAITRENKKVSEWFGMRLTPGQETGKIKQSIEKIKESIRLPEGISFEKPPQVVDDHERKQGIGHVGAIGDFCLYAHGFLFLKARLFLSPSS